MNKINNMSYIVTLHSDKSDHYIQCPCCYKSYDIELSKEDIELIFYHNMDLYYECEYCPNTFYLTKN